VREIRRATIDDVAGMDLMADVTHAFRGAAEEVVGDKSVEEQRMLDRLVAYFGNMPSDEIDRRAHAERLASGYVKRKIVMMAKQQGEEASGSTQYALLPQVPLAGRDLPLDVDDSIRGLASWVFSDLLTAHVDTLQSVVDQPVRGIRARLFGVDSPDSPHYSSAADKEQAVKTATQSLRHFLNQGPIFEPEIHGAVTGILEEAGMLPLQGPGRQKIIKEGVENFKTQLDVTALQALVYSKAFNQLARVFSVENSHEGEDHYIDPFFGIRLSESQIVIAGQVEGEIRDLMQDKDLTEKKARRQLLRRTHADTAGDAADNEKLALLGARGQRDMPRRGYVPPPDEAQAASN